MITDLTQLQANLCKAMCAEVQVLPKGEDMAMVLTPFEFADGDAYQLYLKELPGGLLRVSDMGHTMMHLSYRNDTDKFRTGTRAKLLERIKAETDVTEHEGAFHVDTTPAELAPAIWRLSKALVQVNDLTFLNRERAESTFYEDLQEQLMQLVPEDKIQRDYIFEGIANKDKAQLATIILERLKNHRADYESLLIFADQADLPRPVLARLSNVGGEQIASLDARDDIERKILRKVA